jgi:hypothetical protein
MKYEFRYYQPSMNLKTVVHVSFLAETVNQPANRGNFVAGTNIGSLVAEARASGTAQGHKVCYRGAAAYRTDDANLATLTM